MSAGEAGGSGPLDRAIERNAGAVERLEARFERFDATLERFDATLDRVDATLERNTQAFERNTQAFERGLRSAGHTVGALAAIRRSLEDQADRFHANTQATLAMMDRFLGGEQPS